MAILAVHAVRKEYQTGHGQETVLALDNIDLSVAAGEFIALVGPSGCGKSTLLHIIGGFVAKTGGTVMVGDRAVSSPGPDRGMVFQDLALFPWRTVVDNVAWALEVRGVPRAERHAVVRQHLAMVGLERFARAYPHQLSGGMKQRVALARVLAMDPTILLMDEPFGALDAQTRELMQEELQRISHRAGKTVLFVTHDTDEAVYLADRVIIFTARPGTIKEVMQVPFPRPRAITIKKDPEYAAIRNHVWDLLREEVLRSHRITGA